MVVVDDDGSGLRVYVNCRTQPLAMQAGDSLDGLHCGFGGLVMVGRPGAISLDLDLSEASKVGDRLILRAKQLSNLLLALAPQAEVLGGWPEEMGAGAR